MQTAEHGQIIPLTLQDVKIKFEEWRTNKQNNHISKAKIPLELWQQVSALFGRYPLIRIRKTLNLNPKQLKSKFKKYQDNINPVKISSHQQPAFVPINIPQPNEEIEANPIGKLEIKRPDGAAIFIEHVNQKTLTMLLTQFMQGL